MGAALQPPGGNQFLPLDVFNSKVPSEGPKCVPIVVDFTTVTNTAAWSLDLTNLVNQAKMSYVQTVFVDNSQNPAQLRIVNAQSNQRIIVPANCQAYVPILQPNPPQLTISSVVAVGLTVPLYFLNFPVAPCVWSASNPWGTFTFTGAGYLQTSDVALDAIISNTATGNGLNTHPLDLVAIISNLGGGNALNVNVVTGGGGGSGQLFAPVQGNGQTTFTIFTPTAGKSWELDYLAIYADPLSAIAGGAATVTWTIDDLNTIVWEGVWFVPQTAPTLTAATPNLLLFQTETLVKSAAINNTLRLTSSSLLSSGRYYVNASVASV